jgi:hypothetical protein
VTLWAVHCFEDRHCDLLIASDSCSRMASKGKLIAGGLVTYGLAVYVGYQYSVMGKGPAIPPIGDSGLPFDPKNFTLADVDRLSSFSKHAKTYDSGQFLSTVLRII